MSTVEKSSFYSKSLFSCMLVVPGMLLIKSSVTTKVSRQRLDDDNFLINTETMKHTEQVLPAARHLPLHGQTEIFFYSFRDSSSHCVVFN